MILARVAFRRRLPPAKTNAAANPRKAGTREFGKICAAVLLILETESMTVWDPEPGLAVIGVNAQEVFWGKFEQAKVMESVKLGAPETVNE